MASSVLGKQMRESVFCSLLYKSLSGTLLAGSLHTSQPRRPRAPGARLPSLGPLWFAVIRACPKAAVGGVVGETTRHTPLV